VRGHAAMPQARAVHPERPHTRGVGVTGKERKRQRSGGRREQGPGIQDI
jgi:hypothetical protein